MENQQNVTKVAMPTAIMVDNMVEQILQEYRSVYINYKTVRPDTLTIGILTSTVMPQLDLNTPPVEVYEYNFKLKVINDLLAVNNKIAKIFSENQDMGFSSYAFSERSLADVYDKLNLDIFRIANSTDDDLGLLSITITNLILDSVDIYSQCNDYNEYDDCNRVKPHRKRDNDIIISYFNEINQLFKNVLLADRVIANLCINSISGIFDTHNAKMQNPIAQMDAEKQEQQCSVQSQANIVPMSCQCTEAGTTPRIIPVNFQQEEEIPKVEQNHLQQCFQQELSTDNNVKIIHF